MGFDFFPHQKRSAIASKCEKHFKIVRICCGGLLVLSFVFNLIFSSFNSFGIDISTYIIAFIFEVFAILTYTYEELNQATCLLFVIAWPFVATLKLSDAIITGRGGVYSIVYFVPFLVLLIDYVMNRIAIFRIQYVFPLVIIAVDLFVLPNGFDAKFESFSGTEIGFTYLFIFLLAIGVLELCRFSKVRSCRQSSTEQTLL